MPEQYNLLDLLDHDPRHAEPMERQEASKKEATWGDYGRALASGAAGFVGSIGGMAEYAQEQLGADPSLTNAGAVRQWGQDAAKGQIEAMTPGAQRSIQAGVLPGGDGPNLWDGDTDRSSAIGLKIASSLPGTIASLLPGGIVAGAVRGAAGAAAGMAASGAVSGAQMGGDVYNGIVDGIQGAKDDQLQKDSEIYRGLRGMGMSEADAKHALISEVAGYKPVIMGAIGAASEQLGAGAAVANRAAGVASHGVWAGAKHGALEEAGTEAFQNATQEALTQGAMMEGGAQQSFDWRHAADQVAEGALVGGIMGGAVGGATGVGNRAGGRVTHVDQDSAGPAEAAAITAAAPVDAAQVAPDPAALDATGAPAVPTLGGEPVADLTARAKRVSKKRSAVTKVDGVAPAEAAAIVTADQSQGNPDRNPSEGLAVSGLSPSPVTQEPVGATPPAADPLTVQPAAQALEGSQAPVEPAPAAQVPPTLPTSVTSQVGGPAELAPTPVAAPVAAPSEGVTAEVTPEPAVATAPPQVATPASLPADVPTGGEVDAPTGPRVLKSQDERSVEAEKAWEVQNRQVDRENLKAKGVALAKDGARTRDWKLLRPDVLEAEKTAKPFKRRAEKAIAEAGEAAPSYYHEGVGAKGEALAAARQAELKAALEQHVARSAKAEKAVASADTAVNDTVTGSVQTRRQAERLERAAAGAEQNEKARQAIQSLPPNEKLEQGVTKADPAAKRALKERLGAILFQAKDAGVEIPAKVERTTPPYVRELHRIRQVHELLEQNKLRPKQAADFLTDHYLAVAGDTKLSRAVREQEADEASRRGPTSEEAAAGAREGTGDVDAGPRQHAAEAPSTADIEIAHEGEDHGTLEDDGPVEARERPKVEVDVKEAVVAGMNKAGTFAVATSKRRSVTPPGKSLGAALKAVNRNPTPAQAVAGNYAKGTAEVAGLKVTIENPKGSVRRGVDADGKPWETKMPAHYGDVKGSKGADGDPIDVYLAPGATTKADPKVFVVDQVDPKTGQFDEHKAVVGAKDEAAARSIYEKGFSDGSGKARIGGVTEMSAAEFRDFVKEPQTRPAAMLSDDRAHALIEAELLAGLEEDAGEGPLVTSYGQTVPSRETRTLDAMLKSNGFDGLTGINRVMSPFIAKRLREMVGSVPVHIVAKGDMARLTKRLIRDGHLADVPLGYYDPMQHQILLREDATTTQAARNHLLLHEATHAAFLGTIDANPELHTLLDQMREHMQQAMPERYRGLYGFTNAHEFVSEMFSNKDLQQLATRVPTPPEMAQAVDGSMGRPSTLWGMFIAMVRRFLGVPRGAETMLESMIRVGEGMVNMRQEGMRALDFGPAFLQAQGVRDAVTDRVAATTPEARRLALKVSTLDQIRQGYRDLFPHADGSHLDTVVENVQRIGPMVEHMQRKGEDFSRRFVELTRKSPQVAHDSATLRMDVTMAGVNLINGPAGIKELLAANAHLGKDKVGGWQAKAGLQRLQERFLRLPASVRADMIEESRWYGEMQDKIAAAVTENVLDTVADLDPARRQDLTAKTMAGTLKEDEDRDAVGTTVFNALKSARELRKNEGMYFPLMRHGDHIVITRDHVQVPAGAREIEPGVVEFGKPGDREKDVRRAAKAFAEQTPLKVLSVVPVYKDPTTGERLSKVDATNLPSHDVTYRVIVQHRGAHFFDTASEAQAFRRESGTQYREMSEVLDKDQFAGRSDLTGSQLSSLINSVRSRTDVAEGTRKLLEGMVYQAATRMMSGNRIQHRSLPRRMVQGASKDYARNTLAYAQSASSYLGKLTYMPAVRDALQAMRKHTTDHNLEKGASARQQVLHEVQRRVDGNVTNLAQPSRAMQHLLSVSYLSKLFSPAHSLINATQPWMVTYPVLAGRHGAAQTIAHISRAYRATGAHVTLGQGLRNTKEAVKGWRDAGIDTSDVVGSIRRNLLKEQDGAGLVKALDLLQERGALDDQSSFEIGRVIAQGQGRFGHVIAKTDRIARQLPGAVEAINRSVTMVAAYRLARDGGKSEAQAAQYAFDAVMNTQGDYSNTNAAPFFNHPLLRPMLQFKKYAQMMTYLWGDMAHRAFGRETSREERWVALKQLGNLAAVQVAAAGALSLPGLEIVKAFAMGAAMLGIGGGYDDIERKLRRTADESLGKTWSELVTRGVISRALGVDLSSRVSLADMWLGMGEPEKYDRQGIAAYAGLQLFGAPLTYLLLDVPGGIQDLAKGDIAAAAGKAMPIKMAADIGRAWKNGPDGQPLGPVEKASTVFGIKPARIANLQQEKADSIADHRAKQDARHDLVRAYQRASTPGERIRITAKIRDYNKTVGLRERIFPKSLDRHRPTTGAAQ
ncbi:PLxRFG domain-containing protein [Methylobacterium sp. 285MFTsu5.1]|uniref:PLxRFG domain-containing protein n=1 Tax=Methylobacterium sp. 285MFTsu5.1 TaxID=1172187 RepID=UPI00037C98D0|nr:PLxRFG domain-containing protein [Methylobacterium sp. 285MFTsu5.1]